MAKIVYPERRMRDEHPWTIYNTIRRLEMIYRLAGRQHVWISPVHVGQALYSNWESLSVREFILVTEAKIDYPIRFLKVNHYIKERMERPGSRDDPWSPMKNMDEYQAQVLLSPEIFKAIGSEAEDVCRDQMDAVWGKWIGRKEFDVSKYLVDDE